MNEIRLNQAECLTQTELATFARGARSPSPEATRANAHLAVCADCRQRLRSEARELTAQWEQLLSSPLAALHCLDADALLRFVRKIADPFEAESIQVHLEDCPHCRRDAQEMQTFHEEMQTYSLDFLAIPAFVPEVARQESAVKVSPTTNSEPVAALPTAAPVPVRSATPPSPRQSWLEQMRALVVNSLESLRPVTPTYAFGTQEEQTPRQTLRFDDPNVSGSYSMEQGKARVHIEHRNPPEGALLLLEAANANAEVVWRCFAVCRKGWKSGVVKLDVTPALIQNRQLRLGILQAADLPEAAAETLLTSYQNALGADPAAKKAWQEWARSALTDPQTGSLAAVIRHALVQIAEGTIGDTNTVTQ